jgi:L-amino acid N-acyltransferase YncA
MKFLLDTNIFIPLEPTRLSEVEGGTARAADVVRLVAEAGHHLLVHPAISGDIERDADRERRRIRAHLVRKYAALQRPPAASPELEVEFGSPAHGTNAWVDLQLVAAVAADAVDYLITEDGQLRRRAARHGLTERVCTLDQAAEVVRGLQPARTCAPAPARLLLAHELDSSDPIFVSLRDDYTGFDEWLQRCKRQHRECLVISDSDGRYAALTILKPEHAHEYGLGTNTLKLCTFKVSAAHYGRRLGELLLKAVFEHAEARQHHALYVEVFAKHSTLVDLLSSFGFTEHASRTPRGELVLVKHQRPAPGVQLPPPLDFATRYGPRALMLSGASGYVIPIQPRYHRLLFPDAERQLGFAHPLHPFGNALRKAYLCHSPIRRIAPGSYLLFYRSKDARAATVLGVAEDTFVSNRADDIARFVGKRTVYSQDDIQELARGREVLAILFRQSRLLDPPWRLRELIARGVVSAAPQSVASIPENSARWLMQQLDASY